MHDHDKHDAHVSYWWHCLCLYLGGAQARAELWWHAQLLSANVLLVWCRVGGHKVDSLDRKRERGITWWSEHLILCVITITSTSICVDTCGHTCLSKILFCIDNTQHYICCWLPYTEYRSCDIWWTRYDFSRHDEINFWFLCAKYIWSLIHAMRLFFWHLCKTSRELRNKIKTHL